MKPKLIYSLALVHLYSRQRSKTRTKAKVRKQPLPVEGAETTAAPLQRP